jgi:tetratricopeptide (TPR) repeat protein
LLDAQLALVNLYWARGHPEQGEELLRQVAEANPRHAAANYALGAFYVFSDRGAEAEPFLKHAADAGERGARFALVDYYTSVHRDSDALKVLESMPATYDESGDVSIRAATLDSRQGRYEETLRRLDRLLARDPAHLRARLLKAGVLLRTHKVDVALALAQSTVAAEPESAEARSVLGKALRASAQPVEAIEQFNEALRLDPGDGAAASGLAALYADRKTNLQAALGLALTAKRQLPDDPEVNDVLGWVYVRLNRAALGLEELEAAVSADPNNPVYRFHLGMAYVALARPREAREELTRAVALDGTFAEAADARRALASLTP